jgi:hypothetical protein
MIILVSKSKKNIFFSLLSCMLISSTIFQPHLEGMEKADVNQQKLKRRNSAPNILLQNNNENDDQNDNSDEYDKTNQLDSIYNLFIAPFVSQPLPIEIANQIPFIFDRKTVTRRSQFTLEYCELYFEESLKIIKQGCLSISTNAVDTNQLTLSQYFVILFMSYWIIESDINFEDRFIKKLFNFYSNNGEGRNIFHPCSNRDKSNFIEKFKEHLPKSAVVEGEQFFFTEEQQFAKRDDLEKFDDDDACYTILFSRKKKKNENCNEKNEINNQQQQYKQSIKNEQQEDEYVLKERNDRVVCLICYQNRDENPYLKDNIKQLDQTMLILKNINQEIEIKKAKNSQNEAQIQKEGEKIETNPPCCGRGLGEFKYHKDCLKEWLENNNYKCPAHGCNHKITYDKNWNLTIRKCPEGCEKEAHFFVQQQPR